MIAALYVQRGGAYWGLEGVDPWDEERDARLYAGPWPVVAHPPCARWCKLAGQVEIRYGRKRGDDGGCFRAALSAVRRWGGVLEHPEGSAAWKAYAIPRPPRDGGWILDLAGGWTCCVEQGHYGHRARKATWLYYSGPHPPELVWGPAEAEIVTERTRTGAVQNMGRRERLVTPPAFRDLLLELASNGKGLETVSRVC